MSRAKRSLVLQWKPLNVATSVRGQIGHVKQRPRLTGGHVKRLPLYTCTLISAPGTYFIPLLLTRRLKEAGQLLETRHWSKSRLNEQFPSVCSKDHIGFYKFKKRRKFHSFVFKDKLRVFGSYYPWIESSVIYLPHTDNYKIGSNRVSSDFIRKKELTWLEILDWILERPATDWRLIFRSLQCISASPLTR